MHVEHNPLGRTESHAHTHAQPRAHAHAHPAQSTKIKVREQRPEHFSALCNFHLAVDVLCMAYDFVHTFSVPDVSFIVH